jgi:serine/threonine protein kinase
MLQAWDPHTHPKTQDFVERLLTKKPSDRIDAKSALLHPWLAPYGTSEIPVSDIEVMRLAQHGAELPTAGALPQGAKPLPYGASEFPDATRPRWYPTDSMHAPA